jgi:hypothetical protein
MFRAMSNLPRGPELLAALQEALCKCHGDLLEACRRVGASYRAVVAWREADPEAAAGLREAQLYGWATLESAAYERAVKGVEKGVWYKGECVGHEREYSDGLLAQMLKARVPGYGESHGPAGMTVNVAIMPRAESYEEWVVQREQALKPSQPVQLQPASRALIDLEAIPVRVSALRDVL